MGGCCLLLLQVERSGGSCANIRACTAAGRLSPVRQIAQAEVCVLSRMLTAAAAAGTCPALVQVAAAALLASRLVQAPGGPRVKLDWVVEVQGVVVWVG